MAPKILAGSCVVVGLVLYANASVPNAGELINAYEKSLSALDKSACEIETNFGSEGGTHPAEQPIRIVRKTVAYRDGERWDVTAEDRSSFDPNLQKPDVIVHCNQILDKHNIYYVTSEGNKPVDMVYVHFNLELGKVKARAALGGGIIAEGYLPGNDDVRLPALLRSSSTLKVSLDMAEVDGHPAYVLESQGENGKITLWLDPNWGFHPRRIEMHKSGGDLLDGQPVSSVRFSEDNKFYPHKPLDKYSVVVEAVKLDQINGVFVMMGAKITETHIFSDGQATVLRCDFNHSKIDLNPDFAALGAFKLKVPDGTQVVVENEPGRYMWQNGEIVPDTKRPVIQGRGSCRLKLKDANSK